MSHTDQVRATGEATLAGAPPVTAGPADPADRAIDAADRAADRRERLVRVTGQVGVGVVFLVAWQLLSGPVANPFFISEPAAILERLVELTRSGELWQHLSTTMTETGLGLAVGLPLGVVVGVAVALSRTVGPWFYPYIIALYSLPRVALAPLFIVWFGLGLGSKVVMVVTMVVFVVFYNVYQGVKDIDEDLLAMARSYRAGRGHVLRWIILPAISTWLLTALRLAIGLGLIGAVIAELVGSSEGLGFYIKDSSNALDTTGVFAGLVVITVVAMLFEQLIAAVERRVLRHR
ncbi:ABC transporter permease [Nocardioides marinquilinus]|uniref:ABC transporter permease n=1 Tax=Nocardioides marinquilinus TaxID=1210400 RepID=A0ABP9PCH1_9ACTN